MNTSQVRSLYGVTLLLLSLLSLTFSGCPPQSPSPSPDTTPPEFLSVDIKLENRDGTPSPDTGGISFLTNDVTRQISQLHKIRIIATAGDSQSSITNLALVTVQGNDGQGVLQNYNLSWNCKASRPLVGILQLAPLTTTPAIALPAAQSPAQLNVTVDPVGQAGCPTASLNGFIRVVATNGAGQTVQSKTFNFEFRP